MVDEKDLEIARLKGRLEAVEAAGKRDGPVTGTFRVLAALVLLAIAGIGLLLIIGALLPEPPSLDEKQQECRDRYGDAPSAEGNACLARNLVEEIERRR